jgi:ABC-type Na+ efflux pump permease subunit
MPAAILARLTLLEARRSGVAWLAAAALIVALALGVFLSQLAITESRMLQVAVVAALLRLCAVFVIAAHVVASVRREIDDRRLELALALPLSRTTQYLGRALGCALCGVLVAIVFSLPLLPHVAPAAVAAWGLSLALELVLVAAAALFFSMTLTQVVPALAATVGLYALGRSVGAMQAIASGPLGDDSVAGRIAHYAIDAIALVLPSLDRVTRTDWLLYGLPDGRVYVSVLAGLVLYVLLLTAAGVFDFQRRAA